VFNLTKRLASSSSFIRNSSQHIKRQFHQHFTSAFFVRKQIEQLFSSYVLALAKGFWQKKHFRTKNALM